MSAHKEIRILFEIEDRRYEAVGFLNENEKWVNGDEMLARTADENGGAIGEEDEEFLLKFRDKFPKELMKYTLATNRRHPDIPHRVSFFGWCAYGWYLDWHDLSRPWHGHDLILRRCQ